MMFRYVDRNFEIVKLSIRNVQNERSTIFWLPDRPFHDLGSLKIQLHELHELHYAIDGF